MRVRMAAILVLGFGTISGGVARADWRMPRANVRRTGLAAGTLGVSAPAVRWSRYMGGDAPWNSFVGAAVGGDDVVFIAASDRVEARRADSTLLWTTPLDGARQVLGRVDVDGDGDLEVVAVSNFSGQAFVLDAASGALLWRSPAGRYPYAIWGMNLYDGTGDGLPDLFLSAQSGGNHTPGSGADLWSFASGAATPTAVIAVDQSSRDYDRGGNEAFADLDGDGHEELIAQGSRILYAYSTVDGSLRYSGDVGYIPWATALTAVADVDGDGNDELVLFTNSSYNPDKNTRHVLVADLVGGVIVTRWQRDVADNQEDRHAFNGESVADVDGDGRPEIVSAFYDHLGGVWTTNVWNGSTGALRLSVTGHFAGAADVDGDGRAEVLTRSAPNARGLTAWDAEGSSATMKWSLADVVRIPDLDPAKAGRQALADRTLRFQVDAGTVESVFARWNGTTWSLNAYDGKLAAPVPKRTYPLPAGVTFSTIRVQSVAAGPRILAVRTDGYLVSLDNNLTPTNEVHYPGGVVPGMKIGGVFGGWNGLGGTVAGNLVGGSADDVVTRDSRGALVTLDTTAASLTRPPSLAWELFGQRWAPSLGDVDGDGRLDVLTGDVGTLVARSASTGGALWSVGVEGGDMGYTSAVDMDGDGRAEVGYATQDASTGNHVYGVADSGGPLFPELVRYGAGSGFGFFSFGDVTSDAVPELIAEAGNYLYSIDGASGALLGEHYGNAASAPMLGDYDGDGMLEAASSSFIDNSRTFEFVAGAPQMVAELGHGAEVASYNYGALIQCPGGQRYVFAYQGSPHLRALDPLTQTAIFDAYLAGGAVHGSIAAARAATTAPAYLGNVNAIVGADGEPRLALGSSDGHLYLLHGCATSAASLIDWTKDFGNPVGEPIFANLDGDPSQEILVSAKDGYLYAIDAEPVAAPASLKTTADGVPVRDVETFDRVDLEWDASPGAAGYEIAIQDGVGGFLTSPEFVPVGAGTRATISGLDLALGVPYYAFVRAVAADGSTSFERPSDGFRRVDLSPPAVTIDAPDAIATGSLAVATAAFEDRTGLASIRLTASDDGGVTLRVLADQDATGLNGVITAPLASVPEGTWTLTATAIDVSGKATSASRALVVGATDSDPLGTEAAGGCGCRAGGRSSPLGSAAALAALATIGLAWRRRRR